MAESERVVYVRRTVLKLGIASTSRTASSESFYDAEPLPDGRTRLILLDNDYNRTGLVEAIEAAVLAKEYELVPDFKPPEKVQPEKRVIDQKMAQGRYHMERKEYHSAEFEFDQVIKIDDRNIEANVAKGEALVGQGDIEKAKEVFDKVAGFDELYSRENKHVFNAFGITLRKNKLFDKAIESYQKSLKMDPRDENIHYNIARAFYEMGNLPKSIAALEMTIKMQPQHKEAKTLLEALRKKAAAGK